jgi:integrase
VADGHAPRDAVRRLSAAALELHKRKRAMDKGQGCHAGSERLRYGTGEFDKTFSKVQVRRLSRRLREAGIEVFAGFTAKGCVITLFPDRSYDPAKVPIDPARGVHHLYRPELGPEYNDAWDPRRAEPLLQGGGPAREPAVVVWDGYEVTRRQRRECPEDVIRQAIKLILRKNGGDLSRVKDPRALLAYWCRAILAGRRVVRIHQKPPERRSPKEQKAAHLNQEERKQIAELGETLSDDPMVRRLLALTKGLAAKEPEAPPEGDAMPAKPSIRPAPASPGGARLFALCDAFLAEGITDLRPETRDRYYPVKLKSLRRVFGDVPLDSLTGEDLWRYAERRKSENVAVPTIRQEFSALMQICDFGRLRSLVHKDLRLFLPTLHDRRPLNDKRALSREEFERLCEKLPRERRHWVELCAYLILRPSEVESLQLQDVDRREPYWEILVRGTKSRQAHARLPLVGRARAVVEEALKQGRTRGAVVERWHNIRRDLPEACAEAGLEPVTATDLRGSAQTWLVDEGVPEEAITRLARHKDPTMLRQRYYRHGGVRVAAAAEQLGRGPPRSPPLDTAEPA